MRDEHCIEWSGSIGHFNPFYQRGLENVPRVSQHAQGGASAFESDLEAAGSKHDSLSIALSPLSSQSPSRGPSQP